MNVRLQFQIYTNKHWNENRLNLSASAITYINLTLTSLTYIFIYFFLNLSISFITDHSLRHPITPGSSLFELLESLKRSNVIKNDTSESTTNAKSQQKTSEIIDSKEDDVNEVPINFNKFRKPPENIDSKEDEINEVPINSKPSLKNIFEKLNIKLPLNEPQKTSIRIPNNKNKTFRKRTISSSSSSSSR